MKIDGWVFDLGGLKFKAVSSIAGLEWESNGLDDRVKGVTWIEGTWINGPYAGENRCFQLDTLVAYINSGTCPNPLTLHIKEIQSEH
jgi:hypothetical protein